MIETTLLLCIFIYIYALGLISGYIYALYEQKMNQAVQNTKQALFRRFKEVTRREVKPGLIRHKTPQELYEKNQPPQIREAKEAMRELLDNDPELKKHKELVEKYKKAGNIFGI